ncbi:MAG: hypothetical protein FRX49_11062 [Trebouxia sp. A1-2]|nr:MAG: hypothetical protein FRX49_11062 [Trebouxia sp. A1-2]
MNISSRSFVDLDNSVPKPTPGNSSSASPLLRTTSPLESRSQTRFLASRIVSLTCRRSRAMAAAIMEAIEVAARPSPAIRNVWSASFLETSNSLLLEANIEGAVQQLLVVGATIQHHGQADRGGCPHRVQHSKQQQWETAWAATSGGCCHNHQYFNTKSETWVMANAEFTIVDKDTELVSAVACDCRYVEGHVAGDGLTMPMRCTESSWLADANCIDV